MLALKTCDKLFFGIGLLALLMASAWAAWRTTAGAPETEGNLTPVLSGGAYQPVELSPRVTTGPEWKTPSAQVRGSGWVYDVFTPPEIYYDPQSQTFSAAPPPLEKIDHSPKIAEESGDTSRTLFRLQLVGFVGDGGHSLGLFENRETTEHILARAGDRVPTLSVTIVEFEVKRLSIESAGSMPSLERTAIARVRDELTGEEIRLSNRERIYAEPPRAVVAPADPLEKNAELAPPRWISLE